MTEAAAVPNKNLNILHLISEESNPRGIPSAKFIDNVEEFLQGTVVETALGAYNDLYSKYKYMETNFEKSRSVYKAKIPEIEQTLEIITMLKKKHEEDEEMITRYNLCDTIYAEAKIDTAAGKVCLWIGASTMVEYSYDEALELLGAQLTQTHSKIAELTEDLVHLRENSIIVEVNMARLFNHNVKTKKIAAAAQK